MSVSKGYNRIVFLTTLSVYLGLVLVGGTAPVLAHSALTKHFDVRNEIEFKDDLDNKPDDCQEVEKIAQEKLQSLKKNKDVLFYYGLSLKNLVFQSQKVNSDKISFKLEDSDYETLNTNLANPVLFPTNVRQEIKDNLKSIVSLFFVEQISTSDWHGINLDFDLNKDYLKIKTTFSLDKELRAFNYVSAYNASLELARCKSKNTPVNVIYENTKITPENNQVFIVTHLPRAAIDEFLAAKNAQ